jgi:hypothetical protein
LEGSSALTNESLMSTFEMHGMRADIC